MPETIGSAPRAQERPIADSSRCSDTDWLERVVRLVERNSLWALAALMLLAALLLLYMGRGLSFFYDDWDFVIHDYGGGIHSLLVAHVGNISVFPVAVYKILFHLVGLDHYAVFRLVVIALHLICGGLVFVLAARRIPRGPALLAAALILFLGAAWEDLLWAFQVGYLLSVAGGLAAWVLLERRDRLGEVTAMLGLIVAVGSSSLGIAILIGVAVELAWQRRWRASWIALVPAFLYGLWYLQYGESQITSNSLINAPGFAEDLAASAFGGLAGRTLEWGRPLAVLGTLTLLFCLARRPRLSPRLLGLVVTGLSLWGITAAARSTISQPDASRYIYLGAVVIVLVGVELLRGVTIAPRATALATLLVGLCALAGLTLLHSGAAGLRANSKTVTAELGALELAASKAPAGYQPDARRAPQILAGPYLHTVRAIGSTPADSAREIEAADPISRGEADRVLLALNAPTLTPLATGRRSPSSRPPAITSLVSGTQTRRGGCIELSPVVGATMGAALVLPREGLMIRDRGSSPAVLAVRRFGDSFDALPAAIPPHGTSVLVAVPDADAAPWQAQIGSSSTISICT
jgi:hypothetical protein